MQNEVPIQKLVEAKYLAKSTNNLTELDDPNLPSPKGKTFIQTVKQWFKSQNTYELKHENPDNSNIPEFITKCILILEEDDKIKSHGIYRASGNKVSIDESRKKVQL